MEAMFDDCIERMARGESLESCLQRYHAHADELRDLLSTVQALAGLAVPPPPPPTLTTLGKQRFMRAAAPGNAGAPAVQTTRAPAPPKSRAFTWDWLRSPRPIGRPVFVGLALLTVLALLSAMTAFSISALPGDPFYPPKVAAETLGLEFQSLLNPSRAAEFEYAYGVRRAIEAKKAALLGRTAPVTLRGGVFYADPQEISLDTGARIDLAPGLFAAHHANLRPGMTITVIGHTQPGTDRVYAERIIVHLPPEGTNVKAESRPTTRATATRAPTRRPNVAPPQPTRRPTTRPTARPTRDSRPTATSIAVPTVSYTATPGVTVVITTTPVATVADMTPTATPTAGELTPTATPSDNELTPTPTATEVVGTTPTATAESPTDTPVPPTDTPVPPPSDTPVPPPTDTPVPPTDTPVPPTDTPEPPPTAGPLDWLTPRWYAGASQRKSLASCNVLPGPLRILCHHSLYVSTTELSLPCRLGTYSSAAQSLCQSVPLTR